MAVSFMVSNELAIIKSEREESEKKSTCEAEKTEIHLEDYSWERIWGIIIDTPKESN